MLSTSEDNSSFDNLMSVIPKMNVKMGLHSYWAPAQMPERS